MGLLDILNSISTGAGVPSDPRTRGAAAPSDSKSMSPTAKALLALLAFYALKHVRREDSPPAQPQTPAGGTITAGQPSGGSLGGGGKSAGAPAGGGLGDLLRGPLGGILGGAAAGAVVGGGLGELLKQLQQGGQGNVAQSWIGTGANKAISQDQLEGALGADALDTLTDQTGMPRRDLLAELTRQLPGFIDQLTPNGRIPTEDEAARMI
jgi:uncharacterized protein YidB (DUF937 family)